MLVTVKLLRRLVIMLFRMGIHRETLEQLDQSAIYLLYLIYIYNVWRYCKNIILISFGWIAVI